MSRSKKAVTFDDAVKLSKPTAFSTLVKPVGSLCNFDCSYCYYLDKADIYEGRQPQMSDEILEKYVKQFIEANDIPVITFVWHGGEPLIAGLDFYKKAIEFQNKYKGEKRIDNTLQTNGMLINEEWCDFFVDNNFLLGLSLDGPEDVHDAFRRDKGGAPTFARVMKAAELMTRKNVQFNTLSTVNSRCEGRGAEIYAFMRGISKYMQFLPVMEHTIQPEGARRPHIVPPDTPGAQLAPWSVSSEGFGKFMCDIFDRWVVNDVGNYFVQLFDVALAQWCGVAPALCSFNETCGDGLVVEHNGDVYSCDHFVYPEYKLGNIAEKTLTELKATSDQFWFGVNKHGDLPTMCKRCDYYFACRGECPKHRFDTASNGEKGLNGLCAGYKKFFSHVDPYMRYMRMLIENNQPAFMVIPWARQYMMGYR